MSILDWEKEDLIDQSTGIILIPGYHGDNCPGSGMLQGFECCCDECDYFLICFPEFDRSADKKHLPA